MLTTRDAVPNVALFNLRDAAGLTQEELAGRLNALHEDETGSPGSITGNTVSRWESGRIERPAPIYRRLLARCFDVSIEALGFTRPRSGQPIGSPRTPVDPIDAGPLTVDPVVEADQRGWLDTRRVLNDSRFVLGCAAQRRYAEGLRLDSTGLLTCPNWIPSAPVDIRDVTLVLQDDPALPPVTGQEDATRDVRPRRTPTERYTRYSLAIRDLAQPTLFENRLSYRLLDVSWTDGAGTMQCGYTTYFEAIDTCEALAHEAATGFSPTSGQRSGSRLPFRRLIGDPFDLSRRAALPSIDTLTIRASPRGSPSVALHHRSSASVSIAGGLLHVMPAGNFQPSSIVPAALRADFDLWRNMMREYSEEFLGRPEHDGDGAPIDYAQTEPFRTLDAALHDGRVRVYCLGVGVDALTLAAEILTVAVFDADLYDDVFTGMVDHNAEGAVTKVVPFEEHTIRRLMSDDGGLAPAAAGCLQLAWDHRRTILSS